MTIAVRSNDPQTTVTPEVFVSNLIVMGSLPPGPIPACDAAAFTARHGEEYATVVLTALAERGWPVTPA